MAKKQKKELTPEEKARKRKQARERTQAAREAKAPQQWKAEQRKRKHKGRMGFLGEKVFAAGTSKETTSAIITRRKKLSEM